MKIAQVAEAIKKGKSSRKPTLIGIEGFGGSGKSTIASKLADLLGNTYVVNIDDFIVKENATDPDWEQVFDKSRLEEEVLVPATSGKAISYKKLLWVSNSFSEPINIPQVDYLIIEGISSYHPSLAKYYGYKIWIDTPIEVAKTRGKQRDAGNENEQHWDLWATNDLDYLNKYHPDQLADFTVENGE